MDVRMTSQMLDELRATPEMPDNLMACVQNAEADGEAFRVTLDDDESMAMTEMCEWYIRKDPETGELTEKGQVFDAIVQAIIDADLEG